MRRALFIFTATSYLTLLLWTPFAAADVHPFNPRDLVTLKKLSAAVPSPNGRHAAFSVSQYNPDDNKSRRSLWLLDFADDSVVDVGIDVGEPFWLGDQLLGGLAKGNATTPSHVRNTLEGSKD